MYAGVILTLLATSTPIETTVKYDLTYRPARPSDFSTRMYKDPRVTYLPDYSVRVRTGGKTIWLKRQGDIGLIRDVTIARDGSIQYNHDRFYESDSYIWHRGVATKLVHEEFDNAFIGGYQDRENYYFTAIKDLGPKGRWNTGPELFQVKNGVKSYIGPGIF